MGEMQPKSDAQLLREYAESGSESAFTEFVTRHTDLVYSAALRQVPSSDLACDVAQNVFTSLARDARTLTGKLNPDASLAGWLCRCTRNLALNLRRDDFRRHTRERQSMENLHPSPETAPDWDRLCPILDEAISGLNEADYDALVLRFFKNQDLRSVGLALGVSDDTAQKRVSRALDKLREYLAHHGITTTGAALAMTISANAIQAAPVGLAATISATAVLAGTAVSTSTVIAATKAIAMTTLQKTLITASIVVAGTGIYEARQASRLRDEVQTLQQQQAPLAEQIRQLQQERDDAARRLASLAEENTSLKSNSAELLRLRNEVAQLKSTLNQKKSDPTESAAESWLTRVNQLKQYWKQHPEAQIPEFQFLTEDDWLFAARSKLETETNYRRALASLRSVATRAFGEMTFMALKQYMKASNGQFPTELSQLTPYFTSSIDSAILQRWVILPADTFGTRLNLGGDWVITQKAPVNEEFDSRCVIGPNSFTGGMSFNRLPVEDLLSLQNTLEPVMKAYSAANNGQIPNDPAQLTPYAPTSEQQAALQKMLHMLQGHGFTNESH
jgi:RNA polymerase sigma factor (sigma-70 family)